MITVRKNGKQNMNYGMLIFILIVIIAGVLVFHMLTRSRTWVKNVTISVPAESTKEIQNPDRGGYYIYGFVIQDVMDDLEQHVAEKFTNDTETTLALVEINLRNYASSEISEQGIENLNQLFDALSEVGKDYIVRFLYDWDGKAFQYEPKNLDLILTHMKQVAPVLNVHKDIIYTLQGLFIGNWGEMNGSRYTSQDELRLLANTLARETDESILLAVRTPMLLRRLIQPDHEMSAVLMERMGLFNDGMFGNEQDLGTYGSSKDAIAETEAWIRSREIDFQKEHCRLVPNGGEVLFGSAYSQFESALSDLRNMHVSYLNLEYDSRIWNAWEAETYKGDDAFSGMDGKNYVKRHLGYRFVLRNAQSKINALYNKLNVDVMIESVGFAPIYQDLNASIILRADSEMYQFSLDGDLRRLCNQELGTLKGTIDLSAVKPDTYTVEVCLNLKDGTSVLFANECETGCVIGEIRP